MRSGKKVLCIEDDRAKLELLAEVLEDEGYAPLLATNGAEGVRMIREKPDMIICDLAMPKGDGFFVIDALRKSDGDVARIPFLFITAHGDRDTHLSARRRGCDHFIAKPIDFELLLEIVRNRLRGNEPRNKRIAALTPREVEAMGWVARGKSSADIALLMSVSERTVNFHINNVIQKLGVATRLQAAIQCAMHGLIDADGNNQVSAWSK